MEDAPESIASTSASVSLLLIQSINCLCVFSPDESVLLRAHKRPLDDADFGSACRPIELKKYNSFSEGLKCLLLPQ